MSEEQMILYCVDDSVDQRKRSANMMPAERVLLAELFLKYKSTLSIKKIDNVSVRAKEKAWQALAEEFQERTTSGVHREWLQLKRAYENMKTRSKKTPLCIRAKRRKTEGDDSVSQVEGMNEKLLALLGDEANVIVKVCDEMQDESCDRDSETYLTSPNEHEIVMPDETFFDTSTQASISAVVSPSSTAVEDVIEAHNIISNNIRQTHRSKAADRMTNQQPNIIKKAHDIRPTAVRQRVANGQTEELTGTHQPLPSSSSRASQDYSKSCNKSTDEDASLQQSESDKSRNDYYRTMLDMRRTEHEKRMRVLSLKEWYYSKKILKLNVEELRYRR